ncbi:SDR family NAD(P)-dependent oxidoreductase [Variovorax terrae]|uniref:SDR family oxidoreductase n=1 Tax=Variovorax terrae TaxID=2923278 RepID=A0A9X1VVG4_9BURK|nr:SDR family NAD(P)-dependent oxidoreductase [Variovorax terrae]MCJ0764127.1 SDR family oxidoreductase [Variovorax terrae]
MGRLSDKVCVITGGAGSIGLAAARLFLDEGARLMLVDRDEAALRHAAGALASDRVAVSTADVSQSADVQRYVLDTVRHWGAIDVLFSNAGNTGVIAPLADYPEDVFDQVLAVHVRGAFLACKHGIAAMNDGGSVIITSSVAGVRGDAGVYGYITAKHAQVGLMRAVAKEAAARRIRVNTLHPGPVDNGFQERIEAELSQVLQRDATAFFDGLIPLGRHARPAEIANAALYLASDQSSFTTGSLLMVDGGMSA